MNEKKIAFTPEELAITCDLWSDLKYGLDDATSRLVAAPEAVRSAIMSALVAAIDLQELRLIERRTLQ